jgi:hypothetical protein
MAAEAIKITSAPNIIMTYGTAYHAGEAEDFENLVKDYVNATKIGSHEWVEVNGLVFDAKHHIGSSSIPHGRFTAVARDYLWSVLWSERKEQPKSDIIIRSHVHHFGYSGNADFLGITTPALQAQGTKFGSRRMSGIVDFGLISFDIDIDGRYQWNAHLAEIASQKAQVIKL